MPSFLPLKFKRQIKPCESHIYDLYSIFFFFFFTNQTQIMSAFNGSILTQIMWIEAAESLINYLAAFLSISIYTRLNSW
jgi:hypothetical protein